jgi:hypothetical protein
LILRRISITSSLDRLSKDMLTRTIKITQTKTQLRDASRSIGLWYGSLGGDNLDREHYRNLDFKSSGMELNRLKYTASSLNSGIAVNPFSGGCCLRCCEGRTPRSHPTCLFRSCCQAMLERKEPVSCRKTSFQNPILLQSYGETNAVHLLQYN